MGLTGTDLGSAYAELVVDYSQVERDANQAFQRIEQGLSQKLNNLGQNMQLIGRNMTLLLGPVEAFVAQGIFAFANFDEVMTEIEARTGATADEMERVKEVALEMGQNTMFSATEASQAMLEMLSSGSSLEEAISALPDVLNLAAVGTIGLGESADAVTDILAQFQADISRSGEVVDALAAASQSSSATIPDLIAAFSNVGPVAKAFGLSIEDTAAVLAVFAENGIKGAEAGTQLRSLLNNMTRDTPEVTAAWDELGTSFFDAEGNMRNIDDVIDDINVALQDKTPEERAQIIRDLGGAYGQMGLEALLAAEGIDTMQDNMDGAADASDLARQKMNSFKGVVNQVKSSVETLSITVIGPLVEEYLTPLAEQLISVINKVNEWLLANPELAEQIGILLGLLSVLGPVIYGIGTAIVLLTGPMGLTTLAILAIVAALGALWIAYKQNFMGFADGVDQAFEDLQPTLEAVAGWFESLVDAFETGGLQGAFDFLVGEFDRLKNILSSIDFRGLAGQGAGFLSSLWDWLKPRAAMAAGMAADWVNEHVIQPVVDYVSNIDWIGAARQAGSAVLDFLGSLWDWLKPIGQSAINFAADWVNEHVIQPVVDYVSNIDWQSLANQGIDFISGLLDWIAGQGKAGASIAADWAKEHIINPILDSLGLTGEDVESAGNFLGELFDAIAAGVVDALQWVDDNIYTPIKTALGEIELGAVGDFLEKLFGAIATCVVDIAAWINDYIITPIANGLGEVDWEEIGCFIGDIFDAIAAEAPDIAQWINDNIITPIGNGLRDVDWSQLAEDALVFMQDLYEAIADNAPEVADWVWENIAKPVAESFADIDWTQVGDDLAAFGTDLYDALGDAVDFTEEAANWVNDNILSPIGDAIGDVGDFLGIGGDGEEGGGAPSATATAQQISDLERLQQWFDENSQGVLDKITELKDATNGFIERANRVWDATQGAWNNLQTLIPDKLQPAIGSVTDLRDIINTYIERANRVWDATQGAWNNAETNIPSAIAAIIDAFRDAVPAADQLAGAIENLAQRLHQLQQVGPVPISVSVSGSVTDVPARAEGGPIAADVMFLGAEQNQGELFVSDRSGMVVNNDQLQTAVNALSAGGGGQTINIEGGMNIYIDESAVPPGATPSDVADAVWNKAIQEAKRFQGGGVVS